MLGEAANAARIGDIHLLEKRGGVHGDYRVE